MNSALREGNQCKTRLQNNFITKSPRNYEQYTGKQTSSWGLFYVLHYTAMLKIPVPICHTYNLQDCCTERTSVFHCRYAPFRN
jgi:hypothetical protein